MGVACNIMSGVASKVRRHVIANRVCCWNIAAIRAIGVVGVSRFSDIWFVGVHSIDGFDDIGRWFRDPVHALMVHTVPVVAASAACAAAAVIPAGFAGTVFGAGREVALAGVFADGVFVDKILHGFICLTTHISGLGWLICSDGQSWIC